MTFANNLYANVQRSKIDMVLIALLHGNTARMSEMRNATGQSGS
jgi:hypothetical protein